MPQLVLTESLRRNPSRSFFFHILAGTPLRVPFLLFLSPHLAELLPDAAKSKGGKGAAGTS